ncbi:rRNA maturation RNase YbeY [candidate division WOR-1 bacterium RIFOXYB2_FULL_42_35]|uniref:Endoribonuclease YbeY n=1 Tax=candidate division WOR-1 bacterium RIFOXYC2_FULL_41_25 TaxID=1802586 RepID=A0A1F4TQF4_UNCSA|nr:MAG: rRNA maturation RNase YbeY [candidate division WOR-1 bacterium RIFOXYA2_FULL_41_14]OGC25461.1 MAG: rRNA maturation RNase YbeY [candidate division WOR-1 bacterium RIFOXYB2_FULL_42_35]OGC34867.1 MAG: rRNA maturation RNase YbeY [candidate division WOR-1 bacterium RIFOXYC2_FULL_41_25]OGC42307.1 MAG: rRNA maturation RNase YbeY [candidate division WOR-1 bacterium RIFOXYD2_FULL_41_8]
MFQTLIRKILRKEKVRGIINLVIVDDRQIRKLNKKYRKKDQATDVLSFEMGEDGVIGDIAIAEPTTRKNAQQYGVTYRQELKRLVIHGVLHLLGYDHGRKMRDAEKIYQEF